VTTQPNVEARGSICIIMPGHLSYTPRALKEANTLAEAGYRVRVVSMNHEAQKWKLDQDLARKSKWRLAAYPAGNKTAWFKSGLRQRLAAHLFGLGFGPVTNHAASRYYPELARLAAAEPADLYIAHMIAALPAATAAAKKHGAKLGFDAEDFHRGEPTANEDCNQRLVRIIEERYIPQCDYVTAASDGIAAEYQAVLGIRKPTTILNVFPLLERIGHTPATELKEERKGDGLSLYWYSQVIGPGRGLEDAWQAMALLKPHVRLHLRGEWVSGYRDVFEAEVRRLGVSNYVHILPPASPEQLVERAAQHDVGLALETGESRNRQLALTNKLFVYMLAGLAIAATDVPSQATILQTATGSGFTYSSGHMEDLAHSLNRWIEYPDDLQKVKGQSLFWATNRFNWEFESRKLVQLVRQVLP
jgi:glycosyltransferase involved in cell wall biosynthesis